jgi:hypothetical protein
LLPPTVNPSSLSLGAYSGFSANETLFLLVLDAREEHDDGVVLRDIGGESERFEEACEEERDDELCREERLYGSRGAAEMMTAEGCEVGGEIRT